MLSTFPFGLLVDIHSSNHLTLVSDSSKMIDVPWWERLSKIEKGGLELATGKYAWSFARWNMQGYLPSALFLQKIMSKSYGVSCKKRPDFGNTLLLRMCRWRTSVHYNTVIIGVHMHYFCVNVHLPYIRNTMHDYIHIKKLQYCLATKMKYPPLRQVLINEQQNYTCSFQ